MRGDLKRRTYLLFGQPAEDVIEMAERLNVSRGGADFHFDLIRGTFVLFTNAEDEMLFRLRDEHRCVCTVKDPPLSGEEVLLELEGDWNDIQDTLIELGLLDKTLMIERIAVAMPDEGDHDRLIAALNEPANSRWAELISY